VAEAETAGCTVILPVDATVAHEFKAGADSETVGIENVPANAMILDVGPKTVARIIETLSHAKTLVWNGPLGAFELEPFDEATLAVARYAADQTTQVLLVSIAGGGDTVAALNKARVAEEFTYVSTAGGAFLEWMEGKDLPGVSSLKN
jgi:phosphoglycerate kinase